MKYEIISIAYILSSFIFRWYRLSEAVVVYFFCHSGPFANIIRRGPASTLGTSSTILPLVTVTQSRVSTIGPFWNPS